MTYKLVIKRILQILLAIIISAFLSIYLLPKVPLVKDKIKNLVKDAIEQQIEGDIRITDLDFSFPLIVSSKEIVLTNHGVESVFARNSQIKILPSFLLPWKLTIYSVEIDELVLKNIPVLKTSHNVDGNTNSNKASISNILIDNIDVKKIILSPELTKMSHEITLNLSSNVEFYLQDQKIDFNANSKFLSFGNTAISDNLFEMSGSYDLDKNMVQLHSVGMRSGAGDISGKVSLDMSQKQIAGDLKYNIGALDRLLSEKIKGSKSDIYGNVKLSGSIFTPEIDISGKATVDLPENDYFQYFPLSWSSHLEVKSGGDVKGTIDLSQKNVTARGNIGYKNSKLYLKNLAATAPNFVKKVNIEFDPSSLIVTGNIYVKDDSFKTISAFFPFLNSGKMELQMTYSSSDNKTQDIALSSNLHHLSTQFGNVGFIGVDIKSHNIWNNKSLTSNLNLRSLSLNHVAVNNLKLSSVIALSDKQELITNIHEISGNIGDAQFKNSDNIEIKYGENLSIKMDKMKFGDGNVTFNLSDQDNKLSVGAMFDRIPAHAFPIFFTDIFESALISGKVNLLGKSGSPHLEAFLDIKNILSHKKEGLEVKINSNIISDYTKINVEILSGKERNVTTLDANFPSKFSLKPFEYHIDHERSFNIDFSSKEKSDLLSLIPLPYENELEGYVQGDIKAGGTLSLPNISGNITLSDGVYNNQHYSTKLKDISSKIIAKGDNIILEDIIAMDRFKNSLRGSGNITLNENKDFTVNVSAKNLHLVTNPYLQGEIDGNLSLTGDNNTALAKGVLSLGTMEIRIPEKLQENIPKLHVVRVIEASDHIIYKNKTQPYLLQLDIELKTGDKVYVRGWGVDTLLKGKLNIHGSANEPLIYGMLESVHGQYKELGKVLNVSKGVLNFDGSISPYISIIGTINEGEAQINLILSGFIDSPDISIQSIPSMPQDEALSILLFGQNSHHISTFQAVQLADAARRLSGHGGGFDPLGVGRKLLGVDSISFNNKTNEDGKSSPSVGVGKHLTKNVYLEVEKQETGAKTKIEVQVTPKISIENTVEQEGNTSFGVYYRFDY